MMIKSSTGNIRHIRNNTHGSWGNPSWRAVARQPKEPRYTETIVVLVLVIVVVIVTPLWDCSYPIAAPARRGGIQSEGQDTG